MSAVDRGREPDLEPGCVEHAQVLDRLAVPADVVVLRVCLDGLLWGPIGGMVFALLLVVGGAVHDGADPRVVVEAAAALLGGLVVGALAGGFVGISVAPVAALVLLSCRSLSEAAPVISTLVTLMGLGGLLVLLVGVSAESTGFALGVCLVAGWPMYRSLRRALLPAGEPA